jgi:hypothetical protein
MAGRPTRGNERHTAQRSCGPAQTGPQPTLLSLPAITKR